jgi:hypothetical protein
MSILDFIMAGSYASIYIHRFFEYNLGLGYPSEDNFTKSIFKSNSKAGYIAMIPK